MTTSKVWPWLLFVALAIGGPAAAQDLTGTATGTATAAAPDAVRDLPMPDTALAERRAAPNPSAAQQALMDELTEVTDASRTRTELEAAQRIAPVDLRFGLPDGV